MADKQEMNFEIGMRIKAAREKIGYTQERFAEKIDRSVQYISDLERGKVGLSIQTLINICENLYVSTDFILLGKDAPQNRSDVLDVPTNLTDEQIEILRDGVRTILKAFKSK